MSFPFFLYKLAGALAVPPGLLCLLLFLAAGAALCPPRRPRLGAFLGVLALGVYVLSCPFGERLVTAPLENRFAPSRPRDDGPTAVVVLGGGVRYDETGEPFLPGAYTLERLVAAEEATRDRDWPVFCCGGRVQGGSGGTEGDLMARFLRHRDPRREVVAETGSRTTWENLIQVGEILRRRGIRRVVLVTNAFHMPRSLATAQRLLKGFEVYPWPAGRLTDRSPLGAADFLPLSLNGSVLGLREWVGLGAYEVLGRLRGSDDSR